MVVVFNSFLDTQLSWDTPPSIQEWCVYHEAIGEGLGKVELNLCKGCFECTCWMEVCGRLRSNSSFMFQYVCVQSLHKLEDLLVSVIIIFDFVIFSSLLKNL